MSMIRFKSAAVRKAAKGALGTVAAASMLFAALPSSAADAKIGETTINFSGWVRMDVTYGFDQAVGALGITGTDAADPEDSDPALQWTARWTRLRIATTTPTSFGDVHGYIEMDMASGAGDLGPRLRLAYLKWNGFLIGRAWTTFSNPYGGCFACVNSPVVGAGLTYANRAELIRYTLKLPSGKFQVALEEDENDTVIGNIENGPAVGWSRDVLPALAVRYLGSVAGLNFAAAAKVHQLQAENASGDEVSAIGWGVNAGAGYTFGSGTTLKAAAFYGEGIGFDVLWIGGPAGYIGAGGDVYTNSQWGGQVVLKQKFSSQWTAALAYSYHAQQLNKGVDNTETATTLEVSLLYSPVDPLVFGASYVRGTYEDGPVVAEADGEADVNALHFMAMYMF